MVSSYFSDRELGAKPRISEQIGQKAWGGTFLAIQQRIDDGSFGAGFPEQCPDGWGVSGCDHIKIELAVQAEIPDLEWPIDPKKIPSIYEIFDLLELLYRRVGNPEQGDFHSYFRHFHYSYDIAEGQRLFRDEINRVLSRNSIAFELSAEGQVVRLAPQVLREDLLDSLFNTGDTNLDKLLEVARTKFLSPKLDVRKEALEKLWDAWERLKTLEMPSDKKQSVQLLIGKVSTEQTVLNFLDTEARTLTEIGNTLMIRHTEVGIIPISDSEIVDYLFHRLFASILLFLRKSNRYYRKSLQDAIPSDIPSQDDEIPF